MPEVQNVGAVDYAQYQPSQYPAENYAEDYSMQPEIYDENAAQMRAASKSRKGAMAVAALAIAGLALWGGHALGKRSANDAVANYEKAKKAMEEIEKAAEEGNKLYFGKNHCGNNLLAKIKEYIRPFKNAAEDTKEGVKKAADDAKDAAAELEEKATDSMK